MTRSISITFTLFLFLTACAEEQSSQTTPSITTTQISKPSKFKVAAIEKVKAANVGMPQEVASCVVEAILAGDKYGLGEINQMKLTADQLSDNSSGLLKAYKAAMKNCQ